MYRVLALLLPLLTSCCTKRCDDLAALTTLHHEARPIVALVPVIDNSDHELPWNLSHELTKAVKKNLSIHDQVHLFDEDKLIASKIKGSPFERDISWMKDVAPGCDFLVFVEVGEHTLLPVSSGNEVQWNVSSQLKLMTRLRVVDIRGETPRVVLQEILTDSELVPVQFRITSNTCNQAGYDATPYGVAHGRLTRTIAERAESYILLANRLR